MLKGKIAVVTGGTRGIGYAIVKKYLENGAKVILFGSRQETVDKALASLKEENPEWEVSGACPSLTDAKEVADEIQAIHRKYGKIDILVNNAGVSDSMMTIDCNPEHFQEIINLNVNAVFNAIQPSVELMKEQGGGCIINTSSMVSKYGQPGGVAYPTSKFGVNGLTISLARELGQYGIRVNAVALGITRTDMVAALPEEEIQPLIATIPLGRIGEPEDVANACLFLASELASYVSGEIFSYTDNPCESAGFFNRWNRLSHHQCKKGHFFFTKECLFLLCKNSYHIAITRRRGGKAIRSHWNSEATLQYHLSAYGASQKCTGGTG